MGALTLNDIPDDLIKQVMRAADAQQVSVAEFTLNALKHELGRDLSLRKLSWDEAFEAFERLPKMTLPPGYDSTDMICEDRDR